MRIIQPIKSFVVKCKRVWQVLKKPTMTEFKQVSKVAAIGVLILGALGFVIGLFMGFFV